MRIQTHFASMGHMHDIFPQTIYMETAADSKDFIGCVNHSDCQLNAETNNKP